MLSFLKSKSREFTNKMPYNFGGREGSANHKYKRLKPGGKYKPDA
jgi:hypothetical protein